MRPNFTLELYGMEKASRVLGSRTTATLTFLRKCRFSDSCAVKRPLLLMVLRSSLIRTLTGREAALVARKSGSLEAWWVEEEEEELEEGLLLPEGERRYPFGEL